MSLSYNDGRARQTLRRVHRRRGEDGFTMILALGILLVTSLLLAGVFTAVQSDASLSRSDLDGKRAYSAAQAGVQDYLGQLNENAASSAWWQNCANDSASNVSVAGTTGETYSYQPVTACVTGGAVGTVVNPTLGLLRMEFTGKAGNYGAQRTLVADFRPLSPLSFMWYTVHETEDPQLDPADCGGYFYSNDLHQPASQCWIYWGSNDSVSGPMYTQDQFLVASGTSPSFGRGSQDLIESHAATTSVCVVNNGGSQPATAACPTGVIQGKAIANAPLVPLPADNANLYPDAQNHGIVLPAGTTNLTLSVSGGTTNGTAVTCTSSSTSSCTTKTYTDLSSTPIIYAPNSTTGCAPSYTPTNVTYQQTSTGKFYGACGDIYVSGTYSTGLTLAAADNIVITGNLLNNTDTNAQTMPTGTATMGLVANQYVRVYHPVTNPGSSTSCSGSTPNLTIDAAILTLSHSFFVDNFDCGATATLTIHGAMAQKYRGAVATSGNGGVTATAYAKNYNYDDRLRILLPPYLFDLQDTSWQIVRETSCSTGLAATNSQSCSYQGT